MAPKRKGRPAKQTGKKAKTQAQSGESAASIASTGESVNTDEAGPSAGLSDAVWVIGDSIIYWAARFLLSGGEDSINLLLPETTVTWKGVRGATLSSATHVDDVDVESFSNDFEASVLRGASEGSIRHKYQHTIKGFSAQLSEATLNKFRDSEHVKYIEEDGIVYTSAVGSWGLDRVDQRNLPLNGNAVFQGDGSGTHLYIIDTGSLKTHSEFTGRFSSQGVDKIGSEVGADCHGHGTHCAGTAAGKTYGVASKATVHSVRVLNCEGTGSTSGVIAGMDWVVGNANANKPAVASMSLGGSISTAENNAVQRLVDAGVVLSVAAGNEDTDACTRSPASAPAAITVAATDDTDTRASSSNYGSCVDIFAPGVDIKSSWIGSNTAAHTISGTSMACPHVSGAAAALLGNNGQLTPAQVTTELIELSTPGKVSDARSSPNRLLYIGHAVNKELMMEPTMGIPENTQEPTMGIPE